MANETLSPAQAREIISRSVDILKDTERAIHQKSDTFIGDLAKMWEDQHAVDFAKEYQGHFKAILSDLESNTLKFGNTVAEIANKYGAVSGNAVNVSAPTVKVNSEVDVSKMHDHFMDAENDDEFGFRVESGGISVFSTTMDDLERSLGAVADRASSEISHINAFGNDTVRVNIGKSSGKVVELIREGVHSIKESLFSKIQLTMEDYLQTGSASSDLASAVVGAGFGGLGDALSGHISTKYGGITKPETTIPGDGKIGDSSGQNISTKYGGITKPETTIPGDVNFGDFAGQNISTKYGGITR